MMVDKENFGVFLEVKHDRNAVTVWLEIYSKPSLWKESQRNIQQADSQGMARMSGAKFRGGSSPTFTQHE